MGYPSFNPTSLYAIAAYLCNWCVYGQVLEPGQNECTFCVIHMNEQYTIDGILAVTDKPASRARRKGAK